MIKETLCFNLRDFYERIEGPFRTLPYGYEFKLTKFKAWESYQVKKIVSGFHSWEDCVEGMITFLDQEFFNYSWDVYDIERASSRLKEAIIKNKNLEEFGIKIGEEWKDTLLDYLNKKISIKEWLKFSQEHLDDALFISKK